MHGHLAGFGEPFAAHFADKRLLSHVAAMMPG
jgi:hypothetical protein